MQNSLLHPLWAPIVVAGQALKSRLVLPPMASGTGETTGHVSAATLAHYGRIVNARVGLAFVEYTYVHPWGRSEQHQLGLDSDDQLAGFAALAELIKARGAVAGIQLTHAGGKTEAGLIGRAPLGASALVIPAHGGNFPPPEAMDDAAIAGVSQAFVAAALRAEAAGFQVIEIHCAHGYFFNQWLSPLTNQRGDRHGGSPAGRAELLLALLRELRAVLRPETLLSLRFPGQDRLPEGLNLEDTAELARAATAAGVNMLNVSSGLGGWRRGRDARGEGYLVEDAAVLRRAVDVPVIGVGGIASLDYCRDVLDRKAVDMLAVGRAILENPAWPA